MFLKLAQGSLLVSDISFFCPRDCGRFHSTGRNSVYNSLSPGEQRNAIEMSTHASDTGHAAVPITIDTPVVTNGSDALIDSCPLSVLPMFHLIVIDKKKSLHSKTLYSLEPMRKRG